MEFEGFYYLKSEKKMSRIRLAILIIIVVSSCKKDHIIAESPADISGHWRWISTYMDAPLSDTNPKTPQNSGIEEIMEFNKGTKWLKIQNSIPIDSGTYSTGHGTYTPYPGAHVFIYDSIVYRNISLQLISHDYYKIYNDTLQFSPGFGGSYGGESKFYIKK